MFLVVTIHDSPVGVFESFKLARDWIEDHETLCIREYALNTTHFQWRYIPGLSEAQLDSLNLMKSDMYVKTKPEQYRRAVEKIMELHNMTLEQVAARIGIPLSKLESRMGESP